MRCRLILATALLTAVATFAVVQDRVTAAGARRYVALQRGGQPATIDEVVAPAVRRSIVEGLLGGAVVFALGVAIALRTGRRPARD